MWDPKSLYEQRVSEPFKDSPRPASERPTVTPTPRRVKTPRPRVTCRRMKRQRTGQRTPKVLRTFWSDLESGPSSRVSRLEALQRIASVRVPFKRDWTLARRRGEYLRRFRHLPRCAQCFVCHGKATQQHHVILLKHGGTNIPRNRVPICRRCHEQIHDWMEPIETVRALDASMSLEDQHYRALVSEA